MFIGCRPRGQNMGIKKTSETITVSSFIQQSAAGTFTTETIDLQLNPLDNEVFVVTGVKIDFLNNLPSHLGNLAGLIQLQEAVALTTTRPTSIPNLSDNNCIAYGSRHVTQSNPSSTPFDPLAFMVTENGPIDTPDANMDYIGIVATSDMFLSCDSSSTDDVVIQAAIRVYGYRAKADAATYAALVQSEVLSA